MKKIYLLLCLIIFASCDRDEWLDIKPKGIVIPNKVEDYRLLLDQPKEAWGSISPGFADIHSNTGFMSDDFNISEEISSRYSAENLRKYTWDDNIFDETTEDEDWSILYGQIYVANIVLEEIMGADGDMDEKLQLAAEAKIQRAYAYFSLVNLYGLHYNPATAASNLAVPLRLDSNLEGVDLSRVSVQEIYDFVVEEVESAIIDLPETVETNYHKQRPSKASAYILLARIYLYMGEYEKARDAANSALAIHSELNDYNSFGMSWGVLYLPRQYDDKEIIWYKTGHDSYQMRVLSDELLELYEPNDIRVSKYAPIAFFFGIPQPGLAIGYHYFSGNIPNGFTVSEALLMRAECNARLGQTGLAVDDLNALRVNRFTAGTYSPITSTDANEVLDLVKRERRLEFVGGGLRFFDIKRYNEFDNANITLTHTVGGETHTLAPGSKNWAIPVAQKYILADPEIGENVRD